MRYDPNLHHRRSIRLPGYDYATAGYYFVTICTYERELLLHRAELGDSVLHQWQALTSRFPTIDLDEFVVMPNHVHVILILGAANGGRPTLAAVVRAFKSLTGIEGNRVLNRRERPFWQRNYYERIIRTERELLAVREYIRNNPSAWERDPDNPGNFAVAERRQGAASSAPTVCNL